MSRLVTVTIEMMLCDHDMGVTNLQLKRAVMSAIRDELYDPGPRVYDVVDDTDPAYKGISCIDVPVVEILDGTSKTLTRRD